MIFFEPSEELVKKLDELERRIVQLEQALTVSDEEYTKEMKADFLKRQRAQRQRWRGHA